MGWFSRFFGGGKKEAGMKMEGGMLMAPPTPGTKAPKDPVCGMEVNPDKAAATSVYQDQTYYFCAIGCKKTFDQDPAKYLMGRGKMQSGMHGH